MALGLTYSQSIPNQIRDNARFMSDNLRQIGQQVQGHIMEHQTRKDLGAMAQEIQGMNVQSNDFPMQLIQTASRHPMALRDERGQMAIQVLGKAHGDWKQSQLLGARLTNQLSTIDARNTASLGQIAARTQGSQETELMRQRGRQELEGIRQTGREELADIRNTDVLGQIEARAKATADRPMSEFQQKSLQARERNSARAMRRDEMKTRMAVWRDEMDSLEVAINKAKATALELGKKKKSDPAAQAELKQWQSKFEALKELRDASLREIDKVGEDEMIDPELGAVPLDAAGVVPEAGQLSPPLPAADANALVPVINPQGKPTRIKRSQLESALRNGYQQR